MAFLRLDIQFRKHSFRLSALFPRVPGPHILLRADPRSLALCPRVCPFPVTGPCPSCLQSQSLCLPYIRPHTFFGAQSSFLHMIYSQMFFPSKCRHTSFITPLLLINTRRKYINFTLNDFQQHKAKKSGKTGPPQTPVTRNPIESRQVGSLCLLYDRVYHSR